MAGLIDLKNILVDEYATPCDIFAPPETDLTTLVEKMSDEKVRHIPILREGKAIGIISERDLKMFQNVEWAGKLKAEDIMVQYPYTVITGSPLDEVAYEMSRNKFGSALIVDSNEKVMAIFTVTDALNALIEILRGEVPQED
ncbi:MAG: histidine kinase [Epsilonproteobacteria bacterium]|nr:MAG: histidine kinase [Campylobacterota bacterium]RLA67129.1 MAG: histidine kinase [Campylobacterota bacterium]